MKEEDFDKNGEQNDRVNDSNNNEDRNEKDSIKENNRDWRVINHQDFLSQHSLRMAEYVSELTRPLTTFSEPFYSMIDKMTEPLRNIEQLGEMVNNSLNSIDFDQISDSLRDLLQWTKDSLDELNKEDIYVDIELLDKMNFVELEEQMNKDYLLSIIEDNLEDTIQKLINEPEFSIHKKLLTQTYKCYLKEDFIVAALPIYAVIEHFITNWIHSTDGHVDPMSHPKRGVKSRVGNMMKKYNSSEKEIETIERIFAISVLRGYEKIFFTNINKFAGGLHRNSSLHGYHDYESISKFEYLKLIQLLKATLMLRGYSYKDLTGEDT
ncbi:hypothetical protein BpOF4_21779 (plasmid) [Alkalihalophilus pseudofirmus OF4]|uniref:Uncharacterized protein n=1 Tax=Alkalihalophilus pseudofirmus (strain ATCC BAA-2126 / JCM 17055 / OF4) TaxID=398511 RepID=D3G1X5_ALKPO|nr:MULTISPECIES: hypothetical protein [Alkalihalophilus]ADC52351.1 hypothetical protein BpOF4_21779 [Alkalihalophilus pseudofirmus OF4]MED1602976.1 hypothetical protein [Alkalihalophilus marmarensis]